MGGDGFLGVVEHAAPDLLCTPETTAGWKWSG